MPRPRAQITWSTADAHLVAIEPHPDEVRRYAAALADAYNDPHNAPLLGHTDHIGERDVLAHFAAIEAAGGHGFLTFRDGALVGDADLRHVADGAAEFAFLIAAVTAQGKGLGTQLATMVHAFAFRQLGLARVYASVLPSNAASLRVFEKLGSVRDDSAVARRYAEEPDDITMMLDLPAFERAQGAHLAAIQIAVR